MQLQEKREVIDELKRQASHQKEITATQRQLLDQQQQLLRKQLKHLEEQKHAIADLQRQLAEESQQRLPSQQQGVLSDDMQTHVQLQGLQLRHNNNNDICHAKNRPPGEVGIGDAGEISDVFFDCDGVEDYDGDELPGL
jgi:hypothetical protein